MISICHRCFFQSGKIIGVVTCVFFKVVNDRGCHPCFFFFQFCEVDNLVIIQKRAKPNLATSRRGK
jgi:hypothetical protein